MHYVVWCSSCMDLSVAVSETGTVRRRLAVRGAGPSTGAWTASPGPSRSSTEASRRAAAPRVAAFPLPLFSRAARRTKKRGPGRESFLGSLHACRSTRSFSNASTSLGLGSRRGKGARRRRRRRETVSRAMGAAARSRPASSSMQTRQTGGRVGGQAGGAVTMLQPERARIQAAQPSLARDSHAGLCHQLFVLVPGEGVAFAAAASMPAAARCHGCVIWRACVIAAGRGACAAAARPPAGTGADQQRGHPLRIRLAPGHNN